LSVSLGLAVSLALAGSLALSVSLGVAVTSGLSVSLGVAVTSGVAVGLHLLLTNEHLILPWAASHLFFLGNALLARNFADFVVESKFKSFASLLFK